MGMRDGCGCTPLDLRIQRAPLRGAELLGDEHLWTLLQVLVWIVGRHCQGLKMRDLVHVRHAAIPFLLLADLLPARKRRGSRPTTRPTTSKVSRLITRPITSVVSRLITRPETGVVSRLKTRPITKPIRSVVTRPRARERGSERARASESERARARARARMRARARASERE